MQEGILIGADQAVEELLPWWWGYYSRYNDRPVAVVDFGMSKEGRAWCQNRLLLIDCPEEDFIKGQSEIEPAVMRQWKKRYRGSLWISRQAWFKKPRACLLSPFQLTLWIDLDCEVCGPLGCIFAEWEEGIELAIVREDFRFSKQEMFNSGVILFKQGSHFLKQWDDRCRRQNGAMMGDQDVLTTLLLEGNVRLKELSPFYNWLMYAGVQPGILIAHWAGGWGKKYIRKFDGLHALLEENFAPVKRAKLKKTD